MIKNLLRIIFLVFLFSDTNAQPFLLKSTKGVKPFQLDIYYGTTGMGAFVQYRGQQDVIALRLKSRVESEKAGQTKIVYVWDEVIKGNVTGTYGLTQQEKKISGAWYKSNKNGKQFLLEQTGDEQYEPGMDKYLLHGILISFYHTADQRLSFHNAAGHSKTVQLPGFDHPDPQRRGTIADYNFDGYQDVAFSLPDAGMGVYRNFSIYLYNPSTKHFNLLTAPNSQKAKCSELSDVAIDKKNKLLSTGCRGAATWWKDFYRFSPTNQLIWVRSEKMYTSTVRGRVSDQKRTSSLFLPRFAP